ncbi:MAG: VCBS repeat-containing protein [Saprospiraceae bacterium]|nr:VCBS repeat-containing protein [Pyrinomonadaceae bacterium]
MKVTINNLTKILLLSSFALLVFINSVSAVPVTRLAAGANPAAIQSAVDQFRADLGGSNNGNGNSFKTGRREINWDGAPDSSSSPNNLNFNAFAGRGAVFNSVANFAGDNPFILSADSTNPTNAGLRYGDIDPSYTATFQAFSNERLFVARGSNVIEIRFIIPGTQFPATVSGFGAVFSDVDDNSNTFMEFYDAAGKQIGEASPQAASNGLSFLGVHFNDGEKIAKVLIRLGNAPLAAGNIDGHNGVDVVATDDFIYGEPRVIGHHPADFDGDGTADFSVFRPGNGQSQWFFINSGSNTFDVRNFGLTGDIPVDGDFDGDSRTDLAVFRPSTGTWFRLNSSNDAFLSQSFGLHGDKPVAADYDKDGKADLAVWRPSNGNYFFIGSRNESFQQIQFGLPGDIPIAGAAD